MSLAQSPYKASDRFLWDRDPNDPSHYFRKACGSEAFFKDTRNRFASGEDILFVGATARFEKPVSPTDFLRDAQVAWRLLRHSVPTVAGSAELDEAGRSYIGYRVPKDSAAAQSWAERTVVLYPTKASLDDVRFQLAKKQLPDDNNDQTFLYIIPRSEVSYDFLLHTQHITFDGTGLNVLLNLFLRKLVEVMTNLEAMLKEESEWVWGSEVLNLLPASDAVLGPNEVGVGPKYEETLANILTDMRQRGLQARVDCGPGPNHRIMYRFPKDESDKLFERARSSGFTINNWLHGALSLLSIEDNPLCEGDDPDAALVYYGVTNARSRLAPPFNTSHGYPGFCIAFSFIQVPFSLANSSHEGESERSRLIRAATIIKDAVQKQKDYPSFLAVHAQQSETMLGAIKPDSPPPPPRTCPDYMGDGVVERYLDREYNDAEGNRIVVIDDYFCSVNRSGSGPFFRAWTWRDELVLSADFNGFAITESKVEALMKKWAEKTRVLMQAE